MSYPEATPTLLLPDLPPKTLVGIDLITFKSTPNFHGIRAIPPGWHFVYSGTTEGLSLRVGGWFFIEGPGRGHNEDATRAVAVKGSGRDILVWRWDRDTECLELLGEERRTEGMRYRANVGGVWSGGGLFGYRSRVSEGILQRSGGTGAGGDEWGMDEEEEEGRREWGALTEWLSEELLSRIAGEPEVDWEGRSRWVVTSGSTARRDDDDIPGLDGDGSAASNTKSEGEVLVASGVQGGPADNKEREFSFLPVELKMTWREGAIGRERTEAARDRSWALGEVIRSVSSSHSDDAQGEAQVLGELQFTFLMGLTLMNYSCLQQWKRLLRLILTCRRAIVDRPSFMAAVLRLFLLQLKRCDDVEGGLFDQLGAERGAEGSEFIRKLLRAFRTALYEVLEDVEAPSPVKTEFERLEAWVKSEYDWELNRNAVLRKGMLQLEDGEEVEMEMVDHEEEEEYAPVIVDLDSADKELQ
ncbi:A1 cistron-splicing factor [Aspergillus varians]